MTGRMDESRNIFLYLNKNQIENFPEKSIEGKIIKSNPKYQGTYEILLQKELREKISTNETNCWNVQDNFHLRVLMGGEATKELKQKGFSYSRKSPAGDEIFIYSQEKMSFCEENVLENILFYIENKTKLF